MDMFDPPALPAQPIGGSFAWTAGLQYGQLTMAVIELIAAALALAALIGMCWAWANLRVGWL